MFQFSSCSKFHMIYTNRVYSNQAGVRSNAFLYFSLKASIYFYNLSSLVCSLLMEAPLTDVSELIVEIRKHMLDIVRVVHVYTRSQRASASQVYNKSAITDHTGKENHVINWEGTRLIARESQDLNRCIKEAIWIKRTPHNMNRDGGGGGGGTPTV